MNDNIRKNIKLRKQLNRIVRNSTGMDAVLAKTNYAKQKTKTQILIREAIQKQEKKTTKIIKEDKSRKKLWDQIKHLQGKTKKETQLKIYEKNGQEIHEINEITEKIVQFWKTVYQKHPNTSSENWNEDEKVSYNNKLEILETNHNFTCENGDGETIPNILAEHFDAAFKLTYKDETMKCPDITMTELSEEMSKLKPKKAPGPNGLINEILIALNQSNLCKESLLKCLNKILDDGSVPDEWKTSKTKLIPKKSKPTVEELRPIALINNTYKLFMAIIKQRLEKHFNETNLMDDLQSGFTEKRQTEDNMFILNYCIQESFRAKKPLIVTSIDFAKAFDSIKRSTLIESLKEYKIHPKIINAIYEIYNGDNTQIYLNKEKLTDMEISSGIRQGCNGSTSLFKMVSLIIIQELKTKCIGFKNETCFIPTLFFADDGLLLSNNKEETTEYIKSLIKIAKNCGLEINKGKSKILLYNLNENIEQIEGIKVATNTRYLDVTLSNNKDPFLTHKEDILNRIRKYANTMPAITHRSTNKLLIGKTFWKNIILPRILFATPVMFLNKNLVQNLQRAENKAFRHIFNAQKFTPVCAIRGEIGASTMRCRIMKNQINYVKHLLTTENHILKKIAQQQLLEKKTPWAKQIIKTLTELQLTVEQIYTMSKNEIKQIILELDKKEWFDQLNLKSSLELYRASKVGFGDEGIYDNTRSSDLLFKCRTNTLKLNDRNRFLPENTSINCPSCENITETLEHFLAECPLYQTERDKLTTTLETPVNEEKIQKYLCNLLLFEDKTVEKEFEVKNFISKIYRKRKSFIINNQN